MFSFLKNLLSDKKGGEIFTCFGIWHFIFIALFVILAVILYIYLKNKSLDRRKKFIDGFVCIPFGLYILDFFLMPFAYGEIDIEKLPFHICTVTCVLCFVSRYNRHLGKFKLQFATLGFISNLVYLIYPAGVMWHAVAPLTYRVIQTLSFHGIMMVYGFLVLCYESGNFKFKLFYKDICVITSVTFWAVLGNLMYNDERVYNWFFVVRDPFCIIDADIALFVMPVLNILLFSSVELVVYLLLKKEKLLTIINRIC